MRRGALLVVLLAATTACRHRPVAPSNPEPLPGAPPADVRELSLDGGFITVRVDIPREPPGPKPVVLALLGERPRMLRAGLATVGYNVHWELLAPLAAGRPKPPPAERMWGKWLLASPSPRTIGQGYFGLITADATVTIPRVLDALSGIPDIDMTRVGIAGTSTTGFTALQAIAADSRITAAVVGAACGDYHRFLYGSNLAMDGEFLDLDPGYEAWLHSIEPNRHPERMVHAALLLLAGDQDPVIPRRCIEVTVEVLRRAYAEAGVPERFAYRVVPGLGHSFTQPLVDDMMAWWARWLTGGS
ncbi:MAG TPA: prolyl oligopeptidase family serine peptidase [Candidatus Limnocylindria bacterium]|nr:prolyl oligopeptidase family serine peptidase [Candidatus Limnocylindria bacterium]